MDRIRSKEESKLELSRIGGHGEARGDEGVELRGKRV